MASPFDLLLKEGGGNAPIAPVLQQKKSGKFMVGEPKRPNIVHDNGFLDRYPARKPTAEDRARFLFWVGMLEGAEALCTAQTGDLIGPCGGSLVDANAAYRHFLFGKGADRHIDYERFIEADETGRLLLERLINEFKRHATVLAKDRVRFSVTSEPYTVGGHGSIVGYPKTANWQKALGGHVVWVSGIVNVSVGKDHLLTYSAKMTIHAEDRYNFNPGNEDVKTGIKDEENGQFELCGLAHQYTNYGQISRQLSWKEGDSFPVSSDEGAGSRERMPSDNRRLRNTL